MIRLQRGCIGFAEMLEPEAGRDTANPAFTSKCAILSLG